MKTIISEPIGGDGGLVELDVDSGNLELRFVFPVAKVIAPITALLDPLRTKLEALIPGTWADPAIDAAFAGVAAEIVTLLADVGAPPTPVAAKK